MMEPQDENRADQLEELLSAHLGQNSSTPMRPAAPDSVDPEVYNMAMLAQQLQRSPALIPDPVFVRRLERKILARRVSPQTDELQDKRRWFINRRRIPPLQLIAAILLVCLLIGTISILTKAPTVSNPNNPLYSIKVLEQQAELSLTTSPENRADISLQIIYDRLNTISSLGAALNARDYQQALNDINQQIATVTSIINTRPAGSDRQHLTTTLAAAKTDIRHTLYSMLAKIPLTEQLTTSALLGQLGASVPSIQSVTIVVSTQSTSMVTVTITGTNLTGTTHLIVNNQVSSSVCALQNNTCTFTMPWQDKSLPTAITVMNTDGTAAQTTSITSVYADGTNNSGHNQPHNNGPNKNKSRGNTKSHKNGISQDNNIKELLYTQGNNQQQANDNTQNQDNGNSRHQDNGNNQKHGK